LFDWDILFLVPVVWVGPVLAPCIVSVGLIAIGLLLLKSREVEPAFTIRPWEWGLLLTSGALILYTFLEEPLEHILHSAAGDGPLTLPEAGHDALSALRDYLPEHYNWAVFTVACILACAVVYRLRRRGIAHGVASR
jgi:hypothetical protein